MHASLNRRALFAAIALSAIAVAPLPARALTPQPAAAAETVLVAPAARWVGVYRLTLAEKGGAMLDARVLVEPTGDRLTGMLLVDQHASGINDVKVEDDALVARIVTAEGRGTLVLRTGAEGVVGTLTIGKRVWNVTGDRAI